MSSCYLSTSRNRADIFSFIAESLLEWIYEHKLDINDTQTYRDQSEQFRQQADLRLTEVQQSEWVTNVYYINQIVTTASKPTIV